MTQATLQRTGFNCNFSWLFSARFDLLCFVLPIIVGWAIISTTFSGFILAALCAFILTEVFPIVGTLHGAATWFHYTDRKNGAYYFGNKTRIFIYGIAPLLILLLSGIAYALQQGLLVFYVYMVWTIQHLTQQNLGILLLYHNPGEAVVPRNIEARSLQIPAIIIAILFILHQMLAPAPYILTAFIGFSIILALCGHYLFNLFKMARTGAPTNVPALLFWFISVGFFLPLLSSGNNFYLGVLLPLFAHWCQYIGLNYVLVKRKYALENQRPNKMMRPIVGFCIFLLLQTIIFTVMIHSSKVMADTPWKSTFMGVVIGFSLVHYFQDAFIWRFREQFQRETILPFLKPRV